MNTAQEMAKLTETKVVALAASDLSEALREIRAYAARGHRVVTVTNYEGDTRRGKLRRALKKRGFRVMVAAGLHVQW